MAIHVAEPLPPPFFRPISAHDFDSALLKGPFASRVRVVEANVDVLTREGPQRVVFNLFEDCEIEATIEVAPSPSPESRAWWGSVAGRGTRSIGLVLSEGPQERVFAANVRDARGNVHTVRALGGGLSAIRQIDGTKLPPPCAAKPPVQAPPKGDPAPLGTDDGSRFDIAIFYTRAARDGAGSAARIQAEIDLAVSEVNAAYANTELGKTMRLVHKGEIAYTETGNGQETLDRLVNRSDGSLDEVHAIRDASKADLVSLFVESLDACGIANIMTQGWARPEFEALAFSVVNRNCVAAFHTLAHETGHNMGCCHDLDNPVPGALFRYANGHHFDFGTSGEELRTIMAYEPGDMINYFSSPDVRLGIYQLGVEDVSDHARVIRNTAAIVANFRSS